MKKILLTLIALCVSVVALAVDFGSGMTFTNGNATLDFYNANNKVCYHTNGASYSHVGEWSAIGDGSRGVVSRNRSQSSTAPKFTVVIYLSNRMVTWTGYLNYSNGRIVSIVLNGQTWYRQ